MTPRFACLVVACLACLPGCGAPEVVLDIRTHPAGASVYLSRRGEKVYKGAFAMAAGDVSAEPVVEEFALLGTTPMEFASPLEERESGATVLGLGVAVFRRYGDGVIRIEKRGFETVERTVLFRDGRVDVEVTLDPEGPRLEYSEPVAE